MDFLANIIAHLLWLIIKAFTPPLAAYLQKRKTPEQERAWREADKIGVKWNHLTNKPEKWGR